MIVDMMACGLYCVIYLSVCFQIVIEYVDPLCAKKTVIKPLWIPSLPL